MVSAIFVKTLAGLQTLLPANLTNGYTCTIPGGSQNSVLEAFVLLDHYVKMPSNCMFPVQTFATKMKKPIWYNYASSKITFTIPFVAGVEFNDNDKFVFGSSNVNCSVDYEHDQHVLPDGGGIVKLLDDKNEIKWSESLVGTASSGGCELSFKSLDAALRFDPDNTIVKVIPEERWHNLISIVFVGIAAMYLVGDVNVLKQISGKTLDAIPFSKKIFLIDGPITSISACISLLVSDATSLTPQWLIMQQGIILFCATFYVIVTVLILFFGSKNEPVPFGTLRLAVELPILLAIFAPVVGSRGNLVYLSAFLTSVISSLLVFRDSRNLFVDESNFKLFGVIKIQHVHYTITAIAVFVQAPILMLSVITEDQITSFPVRLLSAFVISFTVPLLAIGSN